MFSMSEVIVVTSGKGGVGKTTTTANIGVGLAKRGKKVVLIDTDTGLRNLDLLLGLERRIVYTLVDVIQKRATYKQALVRHKKYENLFLLPTSQVADKTAIDPQKMAELVKDMRDEFDYILVDCPAGIEQGFQTAIAGADWAIVVTMPEIAAVRDADKIIGRLQADGKDIKLVVNRIRPQMVKEGTMLDMTSIDDILSIKCIGQVPDDEKVVDSANRGEPVVEWNDSKAGQAYRNIVARICGEDVPFLQFQAEGFFDRLKHVFGR
jgi:septum site-determining protein MinD